MRTQVVIIGSGPAGLLLGQLLHRAGIDTIILEQKPKDYVLGRIRAGVLEQGTVELLTEMGVGERLKREGLVHHGVEFRFNGQPHHIDFQSLVGRSITIYAQQEVVKDLVQARLAAGGQIHFEIEDVSVHDLDSALPKIRFRRDGVAEELACDYIAGCDGFHGICRTSVPEGVIAVYERIYPFAWLGILAEAAPTSEELVYTYNSRGFALFSMRSPQITRLYLQCSPDEDLAQWPDDRVWEEMCARMRTEDGWAPAVGPVVQKGVTGMRSFVIEPMQYGRLFLAGDAAHIVPPTGAKGLNLAISDVNCFARGLEAFYKSGRRDLLDQYSATCLRRIWKVQRFSWWMTSMLHLFPGHDGFDHRRQIAELDYVTSSRAGMTSLAENYVGLPLDY